MNVIKNKTAFVSGISLFFCFCLLSLSGAITGKLQGSMLLIGLLAVEGIAFLIPTLFVKFVLGKEGQIRLRIPLKVSSPDVIGFTLCTGIVTSLAGFLINYLLFGTGVRLPSIVTGSTLYSLPDSEVPKSLVFLAFAIIPPICEELFLRGALFSAHESLAATGVCVILSGLCFAMLHGSKTNFVGPVLSGFLCAYLVYAFDCIWPAVLTHVVNNFFYMFIQWMTDTYSAFGIWKYFPAIGFIMMLLFAYLSLRTLEGLLVAGRVRRFQKNAGNRHESITILLNLGFAAFVLAFVAKAVFGLI